ncbi:MAG: hypothetical protein KKB13_08005 [Chloroflexi bacterium]|nr:hypothetical protein [Chloroflexota bacterium]
MARTSTPPFKPQIMQRQYIGEAVYFRGSRLGAIADVRWSATTDGYGWVFELDNGAVLQDFLGHLGWQVRTETEPQPEAMDQPAPNPDWEPAAVPPGPSTPCRFCGGTGCLSNEWSLALHWLEVHASHLPHLPERLIVELALGIIGSESIAELATP